VAPALPARRESAARVGTSSSAGRSRSTNNDTRDGYHGLEPDDVVGRTEADRAGPDHLASADQRTPFRPRRCCRRWFAPPPRACPTAPRAASVTGWPGRALRANRPTGLPVPRDRAMTVGADHDPVTDAGAVFDRNLRDLPPELRWRELMRRIEAALTSACHNPSTGRGSRTSSARRSAATCRHGCTTRP